MARVAHADFPPIMNILSSDGTLRLVVPAGTEDAVLREYETSDGKEGSKWELVFKSLSGKITNIQKYEGDYGLNLMVTLAYEGGEDTISIGAATPFGEDFMKKLPNIDLESYVEIAPYAFTDDRTGKQKKGMTIKQTGKGWTQDKVPNFFAEAPKEEGGRWTNINGYPDPEGDSTKYTKDDWKIYFMLARKFLVKHTEENFLPKFAHKTPVKVTGGNGEVVLPEYPTEEAKADKF